MNIPDEALHQFFGGYFHQDWQLDDPTWQDVISRFLSESDPSDSAQVATGIEGLLSNLASDEALCRAVHELGCDYWPGSAAQMRTWLMQLVPELR
ncbi:MULTISPECIES: contact-dependent growth inhibition system immunity protein [unclassified Duganella]|uniref:contact-dependent growth inhibition system immunity protein n=1 Tax=unclassified Duganella TaxID=2636909 RepID=UPI00102898F5|nr:MULTISPECIES: contact-dependent growth inhibition system immunity protein [unclassified Duganella]